ncbi:saccharopine dehydrogenase NADP-binding domain-containing protein [Pseudomonas sp. P1.8]|uniref:saccharopine dehydrogenase NADP-binding domain-containing protein n=1 Tax=Pseudomonas sp. P1.8 TaxID=1699310 RepID=UPI00210E8460|nr:saccharopine dehydrogenase NADP-binding domain-containing protein [Pseudomonas sp. P1.8]
MASEYSAILIKNLITPNNFHSILSPLLSNNSVLLNLTVSVSSLALINLTQRFNTLYLDTCIEPWDYTNHNNNHLKSNHSLRENMKQYVQTQTSTTTAIVGHGANPGFISILLKKAMLEMAQKNGIPDQPKTQSEWAKLSEHLSF